MQVGSLVVRALGTRAAQASAAQRGTGELAAREVGLLESGSGQVHVHEARPGEGGPRDRRPARRARAAPPGRDAAPVYRARERRAERRPARARHSGAAGLARGARAASESLERRSLHAAAPSSKSEQHSRSLLAEARSTSTRRRHARHCPADLHMPSTSPGAILFAGRVPGDATRSHAHARGGSVSPRCRRRSRSRSALFHPRCTLRPRSPRSPRSPTRRASRASTRLRPA